MNRQRISSGTEWEEQVGYSRAVRVGDRVEVAGTTGTDDSGELVAPGDAHEQTMQALRNVETALEQADASVDDVVRTRMYVADADDWPAVGDAHHAFFADVKPAATLVEVAGFVDEAMLVEVEVVAVVAEDE
ncbi:RidA family protein [Haloarchaeobius sp. DT45]|uniref:RidA family protein n=1 Tax=Haloarchaeobius sp. DT45 TaxID=3446116 RepID=UPI003F6BA8CD